jgi:hypothetical protein
MFHWEDASQGKDKLATGVNQEDLKVFGEWLRAWFISVVQQ